MGKDVEPRYVGMNWGERKINDVELVKISSKKIRIVRERLKAAEDQQKSYADVRRKELELEVDDMVFLKVAS